MKKLVVLGLAGLLSIPMVGTAQKRTTKKATTTQSKTQSNAAAQAAQEKARQEELARQQEAQKQSEQAQLLMTTSAAANPSARPISPSDVMFKKTVWRAIDLREKQNKPMFSNGKQISKLIVDAVKRGELQAYRSDTLVTPISAQEFLANMTPAESGGGLTEAEKAAGFDAPAADDGWGAPAPKKGGKSTAAAAPAPVVSNELLPNELYKMELKEDVVFDKKRSRLYHDIQALTLIMPAKYNSLGFEKPIASFKFSDLVRVFRAHPEEAVWFNEQNNSQHKNLADAFDLWLFSSYITKVSNVNDARLDEVYGTGKKGLLAAQQAMEEMIEWEYSLWSY
ncbi:MULTISPECIES: gliding motility protein GldN [Rufibacter]|uniref:Gliding motility associated protein GldN n=1 Tax=Rufibacter quisquiliarum TaxID=1549639 RepID=A0A839G9M1_9BACT|nr:MULTISPECIES: gliding motility protein GldN [Rufibacter]MBA9076184.1 gliding motility associated protein GldN [Rufibacter quisquiliarum]